MASGGGGPGGALRTKFVEWLRSNGGYVAPSLDPFHELPTGDRGIVAVGDIAEGDNLIILPTQATIHVPTAKELEE